MIALRRPAGRRAAWPCRGATACGRLSRPRRRRTGDWTGGRARRRPFDGFSAGRPAVVACGALSWERPHPHTGHGVRPPAEANRRPRRGPFAARPAGGKPASRLRRVRGGRAECKGRLPRASPRSVAQRSLRKEADRPSAPRLAGSCSRARSPNGRNLSNWGTPAARMRVAPGRPSAPGRWAPLAAAGGDRPHRRLRRPPCTSETTIMAHDRNRTGAELFGGLAGGRTWAAWGTDRELSGVDGQPANRADLGGRPVVDFERQPFREAMTSRRRAGA